MLARAAALPRAALRQEALARGLLLFLLLSALQSFAFFTFNVRTSRVGLWDATYTYWHDHGFFASGGVIYFAGRAYQDVPGWQSTSSEFGVYRNAAAGSLAPIYFLQTVSRALTGSVEPWIEPLWGLLIMTLGATFLALLVSDMLRALEFGGTESVTLGLLAGAAFQNFAPNLNVVAYPEPTTIGINLMIAMVFLVNRLAGAVELHRRRLLRVIGVLAFSWALVDMPPLPVFFLVAMALSLFFSKDLPLDWREFVRWFVLPVVAALALFAAQQAYVQLVLHVEWTGSSMLYRMGLTEGRGLSHDEVFSRGRDGRYAWKWFFEGSVGALVFSAGWLFRRRTKEGAEVRPFTATYARVFALVIILASTYLFDLAVFSNHVIIHPYMFDPYIYLPCVLALFVLFVAALRQLGLQSRTIAHAYVLMTTLLLWTDWQNYVGHREL